MKGVGGKLKKRLETRYQAPQTGNYNRTFERNFLRINYDLAVSYFDVTVRMVV